jgi:hypothetical protein
MYVNKWSKILKLCLTTGRAGSLFAEFKSKSLLFAREKK